MTNIHVFYDANEVPSGGNAALWGTAATNSALLASIPMLCCFTETQLADAPWHKRPAHRIHCVGYMKQASSAAAASPAAAAASKAA